jgi:hypothetical protein
MWLFCIFNRVVNSRIVDSTFNPIAYAYTLLEQSGQFPEATWNV